ncbi:hypothetical protein V5S96_02695 [Corynebacterium mastitidis]|uniref:Uncharacterized protein n=1 Tax=Corynebacterium mastitidis TaxID=161890 RepID=A0ABU8NW88_9CORY
MSALVLSATALHAPVFQEPIEPQPIVAHQSAGESTVAEDLGEAHPYSGSSTSAEAFEQWFAGEDFVAPIGETKDYRPLTLPNGQVAHGGDLIVKDANGEFSIAS